MTEERHPYAHAPRRRPDGKPEMLEVAPLTLVDITTRPGRPRKLVPPPPPNFSCNDAEEQHYTYFIQAFNKEYPDMTATDQITLQLLAAEYIKYLRMLANEIESGQLVSMARQSPGTQYCRLLDMLSVTRKARVSGRSTKPDDNEDTKRLLELFGN